MGKVIKITDLAEMRRIAKDFEDAGWIVRRPSDSNGMSEGPSIYLLDIESGRLFLVITQSGGIENNSKHLLRKGFSHRDAIDGLSVVMDKLVTGEVLFDDEHRGILHLTAEAYIASTRSYATAVQQGYLKSGSFLVLRYQDYSNKCSLLRPVLIPNDRVLSPKMIQNAAEIALKIDREAHPERFPRAKVISLQINSPEKV